jgi:hypothetical protein
MYVLYCCRVENISSVTLSANNIRFKSTEDHSKWAAAYKDWVCIGDINRMVGIICIVYRYKCHAWQELDSGLATAIVIQRRLKFPRRRNIEQRNIR